MFMCQPPCQRLARVEVRKLQQPEARRPCSSALISDPLQQARLGPAEIYSQFRVIQSDVGCSREYLA